MVQLTGCVRLVRLCVPPTVAFMLCNAASPDTSGKYQMKSPEWWERFTSSRAQEAISTHVPAKMEC